MTIWWFFMIFWWWFLRLTGSLVGWTSKVIAKHCHFYIIACKINRCNKLLCLSIVVNQGSWYMTPTQPSCTNFGWQSLCLDNADVSEEHLYKDFRTSFGSKQSDCKSFKKPRTGVQKRVSFQWLPPQISLRDTCKRMPGLFQTYCWNVHFNNRYIFIL